MKFNILQMRKVKPKEALGTAQGRSEAPAGAGGFAAHAAPLPPGALRGSRQVQLTSLPSALGHQLGRPAKITPVCRVEVSGAQTLRQGEGPLRGTRKAAKEVTRGPRPRSTLTPPP